ncbi:hypothetical protein CDCA_CDCA15G3965 [Cyanidium caldarium]|uniref:60S ribosomal protein L35a n=1 Tax=Cyanidium caldarium TaxID=2771 RepID=A0AAV9J0P8_CYACA|nr:hypothetical protein CDCA_CDCA15G3965 [Cyanidium caldarium]
MAKEPVRLYCKGLVLGYRRSQRRQHPQQARVQIEGVKTRQDTVFYAGKRVAYVYKAKTEKHTRKGTLTRHRCIWGKIIGAHGNTGVVRVKFARNIPPSAFGKRVRVMLYPSNI